jgi:hypothetical protein
VRIREILVVVLRVGFSLWWGGKESGRILALQLGFFTIGLSVARSTMYPVSGQVLSLRSVSSQFYCCAG